MKRERKHYTAEEKAILRRHFVGRRSRSPNCATKPGCNLRSSTAGRRSSSRTARPPSSRKRDRTSSADQGRIASLEKKIQTKDEVLAELMVEHVALKRNASPVILDII